MTQEENPIRATLNTFACHVFAVLLPECSIYIADYFPPIMYSIAEIRLLIAGWQCLGEDRFGNFLYDGTAVCPKA